MRYFFFDGKGYIGPIEVEQLIARPGFDANSMVCPEGAKRPDSWQPARTQPEIMQAMKIAAPARTPEPIQKTEPVRKQQAEDEKFEIPIAELAAALEAPPPQKDEAAAPIQKAEDSSVACAKCSHRNPDGAKFCNECGTPLKAPPIPEAIAKTFFAKAAGNETAAFTPAPKLAPPPPPRPEPVPAPKPAPTPAEAEKIVKSAGKETAASTPAPKSESAPAPKPEPTSNKAEEIAKTIIAKAMGKETAAPAPAPKLEPTSTKAEEIAKAIIEKAAAKRSDALAPPPKIEPVPVKTIETPGESLPPTVSSINPKAPELDPAPSRPTEEFVLAAMTDEVESSGGERKWAWIAIVVLAIGSVAAAAFLMPDAVHRFLGRWQGRKAASPAPILETKPSAVDAKSPTADNQAPAGETSAPRVETKPASGNPPAVETSAPPPVPTSSVKKRRRKKAETAAPPEAPATPQAPLEPAKSASPDTPVEPATQAAPAEPEDSGESETPAQPQDLPSPSTPAQPATHAATQSLVPPPPSDTPAQP